MNTEVMVRILERNWRRGWGYKEIHLAVTINYISLYSLSLFGSYEFTNWYGNNYAKANGLVKVGKLGLSFRKPL